MTIVVIGAGVVGMACARALQRAGQTVTVVDPEPPGSGCSHGNAGVIATDHVLPLSRPDVLRRLPSMLGDPEGALFLKPGRLPGLFPWLARMALASRPARVDHGSRALAALVGDSVEAWREELDSCRATHLLCRSGSYVAYETPRGYQRAAIHRQVARERGVPFDVVDGREFADRLPAFAPIYRAVYYPGNAHVLSPRRVVEALAAAFVATGGNVEPRRVDRLEETTNGVTVVGESWRTTASKVVVAAGWRSGELCAAPGRQPLPLGVEMGYHVGFDPVDAITAPVLMAERGFMITPMDGELRVAGTVEFARREEAPDWRRADVLERQARRLLRADPSPVRHRWRGSRPTLPDFLPAIGPVAPGSRIYAAFGHQHVGLTAAAVTGRLLRDLMLDGRLAVDPAPYAPSRFAH